VRKLYCFPWHTATVLLSIYIIYMYIYIYIIYIIYICCICVPQGYAICSVSARRSVNETLAYPRVSADRSCFPATLASFSRATTRIDHFPIGKYIFVLYIGLFVGFSRVSRLIHRSSPRSRKAIARVLNSECHPSNVVCVFGNTRNVCSKYD